MPMFLRKRLHALYLIIMKLVGYFSPSMRPTAFAGSGSSRQLCEHIVRTGVKKVLIVTDKPLRELGVVDQAMAALLTADVDIAYYEQLEQYREKFGNFGRAIAPLPDSFRRIVDRETITIGDRYWQVIIGSGHSPEHATLYCPALKLLISGDQVLPKITPNVSVFPTEPQGDPLKEWLGSSARLREMLPDDLLVLPAHEAPFYGLHVRMNQMIEGHKRDLGSLWDHLAEPRRAVDCFPALFKREIGGGSMGLATGETLAHLNCLLGRRSITRTTDTEGVNWYEQNPATSDYD